MGKAKAKLTPAEKAQRRLHTIKHLKQYSALYAMMILPLLYFIIFKYVPMFGNILAFRRYRPGQGMFGTEWTLRYFERFLKDPAFWRAFRNTLVVSLENLVINFPLPIIFAILLNEVRNKHLKKVGVGEDLLVSIQVKADWPEQDLVVDDGLGTGEGQRCHIHKRQKADKQGKDHDQVDNGVKNDVFFCFIILAHLFASLNTGFRPSAFC